MDSVIQEKTSLHVEEELSVERCGSTRSDVWKCLCFHPRLSCGFEVTFRHQPFIDFVWWERSRIATLIHRFGLQFEGDTFEHQLQATFDSIRVIKNGIWTFCGRVKRRGGAVCSLEDFAIGFTTGSGSFASESLVTPSVILACCALIVLAVLGFKILRGAALRDSGLPKLFIAAAQMVIRTSSRFMAVDFSNCLHSRSSSSFVCFGVTLLPALLWRRLMASGS